MTVVGGSTASWMQLEVAMTSSNSLGRRGLLRMSAATAVALGTGAGALGTGSLATAQTTKSVKHRG